MRCDRVIYKTPLSLKAFSTFIAQDADSVGYHVAFHRPCCTLDLSTNLTALYLESRGPRWKSHKHETKRCCESSSWLISDERESVDPEIIHSSDMWSDVCNMCGKKWPSGGRWYAPKCVTPCVSAWSHRYSINISINIKNVQQYILSSSSLSSCIM